MASMDTECGERRKMYLSKIISAAAKTGIFISLLVLLQVLSCPYTYAADDGIPDGYTPPQYHELKPYLMRNLFETDTVSVKGIEVKPDLSSSAFTNGISFRVFNSTDQKTEAIVKAEYDEESGHFYLPELKLKKLHNYILFTEDRYYQRGTSIYAQALPAGHEGASAGEGLYSFKNDENYSYKKLDSITVFRRSSEADDIEDYTRCGLTEVTESGDTVKGLPVVYKGEPVSGVRFRLISYEEAIEAVSDESGRLNAELLEDIQYMVYTDDDKYDIEPFPLSIKDKSEYGAGRYPYDHSTCHRVDRLQLVDKGSIDFYDSMHSIISLDSTASVSGMKFGDLLLICRRPGGRPAAGEKSYAVELTAANPHRWEISRLVGHRFKVILNVDSDKNVTDVYEEVNDGNSGESLEAIPFTRLLNNRISFETDCISQTCFVIKYEEKTAEPQLIKTEPKATYIKKISKKRRMITLTWKKQTSGISGYQIQLSKSKFFRKSTRTITISNVNSTKKTIRKLTRGKKYYVRIRTYLNTPSGRIYSAWSKKRSFKAK